MSKVVLAGHVLFCTGLNIAKINYMKNKSQCIVFRSNHALPDFNKFPQNTFPSCNCLGADGMYYFVPRGISVLLQEVLQ